MKSKIYIKVNNDRDCEFALRHNGFTPSQIAEVQGKEMEPKGKVGAEWLVMLPGEIPAYIPIDCSSIL